MIEWFKTLNIALQTAIISSITTILVLLLTWLLNIFKEQFSLNYKLKKEFEFEQKKTLKQDIAKNKIPLLNIIEELNYRLYNLNINLDKGWQNITKQNWFIGEQYYLNSFIYRFLVFLHLTIKTETDTISVDSTIADKDDILFLTYIKTFKNIFSDIDILAELNYTRTDNSNHFFKDDLETYSKWIVNNGNVIDFDDFKIRLRGNYDALEKVIEYFSTIQNNNDDKSLNVLRCFLCCRLVF